MAVETIYTGFSSKKALLRAAMDVAIVGDAEPVPWLEREEIRRLRQLPLQERAAAGMRLVGQMYSDRVTGVWSAMLEAAASGKEVAAWCAEIEKGRHEIVRESCEIVFQRPVRGQVLDVLWVLTSPDAYTKLARPSGAELADAGHLIRLRARAPRSG